LKSISKDKLNLLKQFREDIVEIGKVKEKRTYLKDLREKDKEVRRQERKTIPKS
jgi:hypothetical protein